MLISSLVQSTVLPEAPPERAFNTPSLPRIPNWMRLLPVLASASLLAPICSAQIQTDPDLKSGRISGEAITRAMKGAAAKGNIQGLPSQNPEIRALTEEELDKLSDKVSRRVIAYQEEKERIDANRSFFEKITDGLFNRALIDIGTVLFIAATTIALWARTNFKRRNREYDGISMPYVTRVTGSHGDSIVRVFGIFQENDPTQIWENKALRKVVANAEAMARKKSGQPFLVFPPKEGDDILSQLRSTVSFQIQSGDLDKFIEPSVRRFFILEQKKFDSQSPYIKDAERDAVDHEQEFQPWDVVFAMTNRSQLRKHSRIIAVCIADMVDILHNPKEWLNSVPQNVKDHCRILYVLELSIAATLKDYGDGRSSPVGTVCRWAPEVRERCEQVAQDLKPLLMMNEVDAFEALRAYTYEGIVPPKLTPQEEEKFNRDFMVQSWFKEPIEGVWMKRLHYQPSDRFQRTELATHHKNLRKKFVAEEAR